jgi:hypothetical protein
MKAYADRLRRERYAVEYRGFASVQQPGRLFALLREGNVGEVYVADPVDHALSLELEKDCRTEELLLSVREGAFYVKAHHARCERWCAAGLFSVMLVEP